MVNNIKISVIMPSLNVGEYIEKCLLSVMNQSFKDIEIISIDAGSTDGTVEILEKYAKIDSRITLLKSDEKSYGHQVNMGINHAKGDYISIIETDDFIDENMFESLYELSDNSKVDIIKGTFFHYNDYDKNNIIYDIDNSKESLQDSKSFTIEENPIFIDGHPSIWAGIYRREFLEDNDIKFVEAPAGGWVDNPFFLETAIAAKSIVYTHQPFYYYCVSNPNSSSNTLNDFNIPLDRITEMFKILEKYHCDDEDMLVIFYNRLFRYIEIIIENNNNTDEDLDYDVCLKIHEIMEKVDKTIVMNKLKFNFQKMYYKYSSPLFLSRFKKLDNLTDENYEILIEENDFLHNNLTYFRNKFNDVNYQKSQLEKKYEDTKKLLDISEISLSKKPKIERRAPQSMLDIEEIKNKKEEKHVYKNNKSEYSVSVIMPVFNGAKFLERSMDSLFKQTLKNFEIILIDDGSTDNSLEILRSYEREYSFVKVLSQENSGSGKARNYGIDEAKGEYIAFLDADDFFIDDDALEKMYTLAILNNADMVSANIKHDVDNEGNFVPFGQFHYYTSNEVILPEQYGIPWSFYKNIFKRDFLVENNIYFPDLLRGQDPVFLAEVLTKVDKIYVAATDLYAYVYNSDTAKASNPRKLYDQLLHYRQVIDYLSDPKFSKRQDEYYQKIMLFCSRLADDDVVNAILFIRDIFSDMPEFLRRIEDYLHLKFSYLPEVNELISWLKVSVIMEVRNSESLFEKSFNSLINQKMNDFEIILINCFEDDIKFEYVRQLLGNDENVKFLEGEDIISLRNYALEESNGDYIYFCDDSYIFEDTLFEDLLENSLMAGSEICLCNIPKGGENKNSELNFGSILGNRNFLFYHDNWQKIMPYIFSSSFELTGALYKKSFLDKLSVNEKLLIDRSVLQIKSILNASKLSFVNKFLFDYLTKDNIFYDFKSPAGTDCALNIFDICDDIENFLKEKMFYDDLKVYFDIYKINQILLYLNHVRFNGCYSYNDPKNRDLYANNDIVLDYSQYYGSKSEYLGLDYSYADVYFNKTKEEFTHLFYDDFNPSDLQNNKFLDRDNLNKFYAVLKSDSYEEYRELSNFSNVEKLRNRNIELKQKIHNLKYNELDSLEKSIEENESLVSKLQNDVSELNRKNETLVDETNQLRELYWKNRELYDYILASKSWKYTKWLRHD